MSGEGEGRLNPTLSLKVSGPSVKTFQSCLWDMAIPWEGLFSPRSDKSTLTV